MQYMRCSEVVMLGTTYFIPSPLKRLELEKHKSQHGRKEFQMR